jgi:hypothetical protein
MFMDGIRLTGCNFQDGGHYATRTRPNNDPVGIGKA